nr:MAG TPA: Cell surface protein [Caudoviricetes sp.]
MGTIAENIQRIQNAKAAIKAALEEKGAVVGTNVKIDGYADIIAAQQTGNPATVDFIQNLFDGNFTGELVVPDGLTKITKQYSIGFGKQTSLVFPDSVIEVGAGTVQYCREMRHIEFGVGLQVLNSSAIEGANSLRDVVVKATVPPTIAGPSPFSRYGMFNQVDNVYVPAGSVNAYKSAPGWQEGASKIKAI